MTRALALALPLFALAGCDSLGIGEPSVDLSNATMAEVAAEAVKVQQQRPGQWEMTSQLVSLEVEGVPEDSPMNAMLKQQVGQANTDSQCLTEEAAKKAMVPQDVDPNNRCRFAHFRMKGGQIDADMTCPAPDGAGTLRMTQKGSYSPDAYDVTSTLTRAGGTAPGENSTMTMKVSAKRTGECKA